MKRFSKGSFLVTTFLAVASCSGLITKEDRYNDPIDRQAGRTRSDYLESLTPKPDPVVSIETKPPIIPPAADLLITPPKPVIGVNKTVSLSVTEEVPLKDVFIELARLADVDIEVDPNITQGVIFKAKNRPFDEVIERISDLAGLKYTVNNGVIRVMQDIPYVETYQMSFLNMVRGGAGKISANTTLRSTGDSDSGGGSGDSGGSSSSSSSGGSGEDSETSNGSESSIEYKTGVNDVWTSILGGIGTITGDPSIMNAASSSAPSLGSESGNSGGGSSVSSTTSVPTGANNVSINREAGIISIRASGKQHAMISEYLQKVKQYYSGQVLIEAKVVEIALNDQFRSGVDWNVANARILGGDLGVDLPGGGFQSLPTPDIDTDDLFSTVTFNSGDLNVAVRLAEIFGTTRTLSSPRIMAMNNQPATLSFAQNENYFTLDCDVTPPTISNDTVVPATISVGSQLNSVPIGVILSLMPAIDAKNSQVALNIRPTLTRLTGKVVNDPSLSICAANAVAAGVDPQIIEDLITENPIPQIDVREMDSVLKIRDGEILVIGGMIDQQIENNDSGVPVLSDIPYLGNAFKAVDKSNQTVQTVIFLKATIVPGYGVDDMDKTLYKKFNNDPRPLKF